MALFKKEPAAVRMRADLAKLNDHRTELAEQLDQVKASAVTLNAKYAELIGVAGSEEVAIVETALLDNERRVSSLNSRLSVLDQKIVATQAALDEHLAHEAAEKVAADLDKAQAEFTRRLAALVTAADELLPVATKVAEHVFSAKEVATLARLIGEQVPGTGKRITSEAAWTADLIRRERPAKHLTRAA